MHLLTIFCVFFSSLHLLYANGNLSDLSRVNNFSEASMISSTVLPDEISDSEMQTEFSYLKTSFLLVSDVEVDSEAFDVSRVLNIKNDEHLELQGDDTNITHEAEVARQALDKSVYVLPPLTVDIGEGTNLLMTPNVKQEIYFEVTNNLKSATRVSFSVRDEMRILVDIDKYIADMGPLARTSVRVTVFPRIGISSDRITFTARGSEQTRKEVIVDFADNYRSDDDAPEVDYTYSSDCTDVLLSKCEHGTWTINVAARDSNSGLMLLTTVPKGLYFSDGYTSGTKEEITGSYSDTCCNPDLQIIAVDRMNNRVVKQANAYRAPLSFWAIIAIVLVSLIVLIVIIVIIIFCVKKFKKKEADSFDLPTYRGGRSRY